MRHVILVFTFSLFALLSIQVACGQQVKHIVVFKYKAAATPDQISQVTKAFKQLQSKISGIISFEAGVNNSPEKLNKGFTHIYLLTFESIAARNAYLVHPDHKKFTEYLGKSGLLDEPFVVDFEVGS